MGSLTWSARPCSRRPLLGVVVGLFILAVSFGLLLFVTRASAYLQSPVFLAKMLALAAGIADTVILRTAAARWSAGPGRGGARAPAGLRAAGGASIAVWLAVLVLGRLIGYF